MGNADGSRSRSLTASEKMAEHALVFLRLAGFVPARPYDVVTEEAIKSASIVMIAEGVVAERRTREITFDWGCGLYKVTITLTKKLEYKFKDRELHPVTDDTSDMLWGIEKIVVRGRGARVTFEGEGILDFLKMASSGSSSF